MRRPDISPVPPTGGLLDKRQRALIPKVGFHAVHAPSARDACACHQDLLPQLHSFFPALESRPGAMVWLAALLAQFVCVAKQERYPHAQETCMECKDSKSQNLQAVKRARCVRRARVCIVVKQPRREERRDLLNSRRIKKAPR
jgi:hypothetical protein